MTNAIDEFLLRVKAVNGAPKDLPLTDKIKRLDLLDQAACEAAPAIEELREFAKLVIQAVGHSDMGAAREIDVKLGRIRELVG